MARAYLFQGILAIELDWIVSNESDERYQRKSQREQDVIVEKGNGIGRILLNRPHALNAVDEKMGRELAQSPLDLETDREVRYVILIGAGRAFCAGEDIPSFKARNFASLGRLLEEKYHPIIQRIRSMEKPVIAKLKGVAAGGGASIALACDVRIASSEASIKMSFIGMGLVPDAGISYFLTELVGRGRAIELIMTGRTVSSDEALSLGLFNKVVPPAELDKTVEDLAARLAKGPRTALGLSKRVMNRVAQLPLSEALEFEAACQQIASETSDHREAVNAFLEKRLPKFA